jgi:hypothetical protein
MHPSQMYALAQIQMAEDQARAEHSRIVAGRRPEPLWHAVRARLRHPGARRRTVAPLAPQLKHPAS